MLEIVVFLLLKQERTHLEDVYRYCIYTIEEHISTNKSNKEISFVPGDNGEYSDKNSIISNYEKLFDSGNYELDSGLYSIKKNGDKTKKENKEEWEKIVSWCKSVVGRAYKGDNDNLFKLAIAFCTKD